MNCKPGDLAIVVRTMGVPGAEKILGRTFDLLFRGEDMKWGVMWRVKTFIYDGVKVDLVADCILKPLRDPGDDAKDEMLRPLPIKEVA